ncbi:MAG: cytochrome c oxidase subunit 3 [Maricaulaceae bacterium]
MAEAVEHDYHLIPPSPWPFLSGVACLVWGMGMVVFFAGLVDRNPDGGNGMMEFFFSRGIDTLQGREGASGGWILLVLGCLFAAYVMYGWWRDVARESAAGDHTPVVDIGLRYGMIMFIMQEAMFFVGWFWMFFEMKLFQSKRAEWDADYTYDDGMGALQGWASGDVPNIETINPWHLPLMNTLVLLLSGTTVTWAHHALIHGDRKGAKWGLLLTVLLGILFTYLQGVEYAEAFAHRDDVSFWLSTNLYGSAFFLATGFHGLHVLIGTIFLFVCYLRLVKGGFTPEKHFGLEAAAWYWHFVDVVWLFLFAFVYVVFQ